MLAGRLETASRTFAVREVPEPEPGRGEVRVRVRAAGVCLSDVHLIDGSLRPSFSGLAEVTLGHEVAGEIDALGSDVPGWSVGDRVLLRAGERCGTCATCVRFRLPCLAVRARGIDYDGGWAEYAVASHHTLVAIPDELPFEQAAIVPDAVSTPWGAVAGTGRAGPARPAGVWGAGGLGAHAVQLLRLVGAAPIVAVDPRRAARERALDLGADAVFAPDDPELPAAVRAVSGGGLDVAFDLAGAARARAQALDCLAPGGRLVLVGLTPEPLRVDDATTMTFNGQQILGHYGSLPGAVDQLVTLIRHGRLDLSRSVSGLVALADAADAVARVRDGIGDPVRLVLVP